MKRDWFWQLRDLGQGPDNIFLATFAPTDTQRLAEVVHRHLPPDFVRCTEFYDAHERGEYAVFEKYVDRHTHGRMVDNRSRSQPASIWYYGEISVEDHRFMIEHNNCQGIYDDTGLVIALARSPALSLQEWKVVYSGFSYGEVASGADAASLREYLHLQD